MLYSHTTGTGPDLALLHGWGFNAELFNNLIDQYQDQYRITKIDLPGHGRSAEVAGGIDEWSNEIIKILPNNPILLGWSLGGLLAINIATKIKLSKLILVASTPISYKILIGSTALTRIIFSNFPTPLSKTYRKV